MGILTAAHWAYLVITILLFVAILRKKEIVIISIAGILLVTLIYSYNPVFAVQALCQSVLVGFRELLPIFIGISLILAMTNAIKSSGAISVLAKPMSRINIRPNTAFLLIGFSMFIVSLLIWPSPAVALMGAFLIPLAGKLGLSRLYIAVAINLFGHGIALSGDFFIQGVPSIVAESAGLHSKDIMPYLVPLWAVMSVVTIVVAMIMMKKEHKSGNVVNDGEMETTILPKQKKRAIISFIVTVVLFVTDIVAMIITGTTGDDATYLVSGTALIATCVICLICFNRKESANRAMEFVTSGFSSTMKIFAPALVIIAFFSLGNESMAQSILGESAPGFIGDFVNVIVSNIKIPDGLLAVVQTFVGTIYSIDGSGFAGLTVIGEITHGYGVNMEQLKLLISLGQVVIIWVGGGTLIPWSIVPVASVCKVSPMELAKKNFVPVICGLIATTIFAAIWLFIL